MGRSGEAETNTLSLEDMETETFDMIIQWIYTGRYQLPDNEFGLDPFQTGQRDVSRYIDLILSANMLLINSGSRQDLIMSTLKDIEAIVARNPSTLTPESVRAAFLSRSIEINPLRELITKHLAIPYLNWKQDKAGNLFPFDNNLRDGTGFGTALLDAVAEHILCEEALDILEEDALMMP